MPPDRYDAIVIGAGQGGGPLARAWAAAGRRTALIERAFVGGTCINYGCTPTKTMAHAARVANYVRRAGDYGARATFEKIDMAKVRQIKRAIVDDFRSDAESGLEKTEHLDLIYGQARFTGPRGLDVALRDGGTRSLYADQLFIDTGCRPLVPPIQGLADVPILDNAKIMELDVVPDHLLILGGGYIGLEFGQMFRRFGSKVTIIERAPQLLAREDEDVAQVVLDILREDGIEVRLQTTANKVERMGEGVKLKVGSSMGDEVIDGSHLLVAVGIRPNTDDLNLQSAGVEMDDRGYIKANERLETTAEGIYAIGDVKGGPAFTHISYDDYRILRANLLGGGSRTTADRPVPYCMFTDPQLGRIGLSEKEAKEQGRPYKLAKMDMSHVARALEMNESRGLVKALVDPVSRHILGAAILGVEGGEVMAMIQLAMMGNIPVSRLRDAVFAHPTLAELLNNLFADT